MNDEQIIQSVISKNSIKKLLCIPENAIIEQVVITSINMIMMTTEGRFERVGGIKSLIFSKEFAIALWGEKFECKLCFIKKNGFPIIHEKTAQCGLRETPEWLIGLRLLVEEKKPIKFLEKFL